jgi:hypothetical protein
MASRDAGRARGDVRARARDPTRVRPVRRLPRRPAALPAVGDTAERCRAAPLLQRRRLRRLPAGLPLRALDPGQDLGAAEFFSAQGAGAARGSRCRVDRRNARRPDRAAVAPRADACACAGRCGRPLQPGCRRAERGLGAGRRRPGGLRPLVAAPALHGAGSPASGHRGIPPLRGRDRDEAADRLRPPRDAPRALPPLPGRSPSVSGRSRGSGSGLARSRSSASTASRRTCTRSRARTHSTSGARSASGATIRRAGR